MQCLYRVLLVLSRVVWPHPDGSCSAEGPTWFLLFHHLEHECLFKKNTHTKVGDSLVSLSLFVAVAAFRAESAVCRQAVPSVVGCGSGGWKGPR